MGAQLSEQEHQLESVQTNQEQLASQVAAVSNHLNSQIRAVQAEAKSATELANAAHYRLDKAGADRGSSDEEDDEPLSARCSALATKEKKREKKSPKRDKEKKPPKSEKEPKGAKRKAAARVEPEPVLNLRQMQKQRLAEENKLSKLLLGTDESKKVVKKLVSLLAQMGFDSTLSRMADFLVTNFNDSPLVVDVDGSLKVDLETLAAVDADSVIDRWMAQDR
jgi:hypothetical protein